MTHTMERQLWNVIASVMSRREWEAACASVGRRDATVQQKRWCHWEGKGAWHLTEWYNAMMDSFQNYYGSAIWSNVGNLEEVRKAVLTIYHHFVSTNANPTAQLLPQGWNIVVQVPISSGKEGSWTFHPQEDHSSRCCQSHLWNFHGPGRSKAFRALHDGGNTESYRGNTPHPLEPLFQNRISVKGYNWAKCGTCCLTVEQCS